jgi:hypothetical protein
MAMLVDDSVDLDPDCRLKVAVGWREPNRQLARHLGLTITSLPMLGEHVVIIAGRCRVMHN